MPGRRIQPVSDTKAPITAERTMTIGPEVEQMSLNNRRPPFALKQQLLAGLVPFGCVVPTSGNPENGDGCSGHIRHEGLGCNALLCVLTSAHSH